MMTICYKATELAILCYNYVITREREIPDFSIMIYIIYCHRIIILYVFVNTTYALLGARLMSLPLVLLTGRHLSSAPHTNGLAPSIPPSQCSQALCELYHHVEEGIPDGQWQVVFPRQLLC